MATAFTPWASLAGGALIGLAAVLLVLLHGRVLSATGILAGAVLPSDRASWAWRAAALTGMVSAPSLLWAVTGEPLEIAVPVDRAALIVGGVLVGVGVTLGNGCRPGTVYAAWRAVRTARWPRPGSSC